MDEVKSLNICEVLVFQEYLLSKCLKEWVSVHTSIYRKTHQCVYPNNTTHPMFTDKDSKDSAGTHICGQIRQHGQCVLIPLDRGADYTVSGSKQGLSTATFLGGLPLSIHSHGYIGI